MITRDLALDLLIGKKDTSDQRLCIEDDCWHRARTGQNTFCHHHAVERYGAHDHGVVADKWNCDGSQR